MEEAPGRNLPPPGPGDFEPYYLPPAVPRRDRVWVHVLLLALTALTTTIAGAFHNFFFVKGFSGDAFLTWSVLRDPGFYLGGIWYSVSILVILGCHEMGHYLACRYYRVDATLPFFLPAPFPLTGTLGAVIRIRQRFPSKIALFDIGIAGPIAGFVVTVPALFLGLALSSVERIPDDFSGAEMGEPLLFRAVAWLIFGDLPPGMSINMHPIGFAAWFGLLATAINLFPISQLDGGHISYAVLGRRSTLVTLTGAVVAISLSYVSQSWILMSVLIVVMLLLVGPHHPPTLNDDRPIDRGRLILAIVALAILIVCFTPVPIGPFVTGQ